MSEMLIYSESYLEKWASFSGDRNSIHFNKELVKGLGANNLIVHGMLVMLTMKQLFTDIFLKTSTDIDVKFTLNRRVELEKLVSLNVESKKIKFG